MNSSLKVWLSNSQKLQGETASEIKALKCFNNLLTWVVKKNYQGACHDLSIALHVLLSEVGLESNICIGEVKISDSEYFDHSWVEVNGCIYDIAVCAPNLYQYSHAPIFRGKSLSECGTINFGYGIGSPEGIDEMTQFVLGITVSEYLEHHPNGVDFIWSLIKKIAHECNIKLNKMKLKNKYSNTKRILKY